MSAETTSAFTVARGLAGAIGRAACTIDVELLEDAIADGDRALALGPILDPTLTRDAAPELELELKVLRALLTFRRELEELRP